MCKTDFNFQQIDKYLFNGANLLFTNRTSNSLQYHPGAKTITLKIKHKPLKGNEINQQVAVSLEIFWYFPVLAYFYFTTVHQMPWVGTDPVWLQSLVTIFFFL